MVVIGNPATLGKNGIPISLTVTASTGTVITITKGTKTITGTITSGTSYTFSLPEAGTWTVSGTWQGITSTKNVTITSNYSTALFFVGASLNDTEWEVISGVSTASLGSSYWAIGDRKAVRLNGTVGACTFSNTTYYTFIIGFNHNSSYEGSNRIHFQFGKTALTGGTDISFIDSSYGSSVSSSGKFTMSSTSRASNSGGWSSSHMRNTICGTSLSSYSGTFIGVLPSDLRSVLKTITKYTDNTGNSSTTAANVTATTDIIFLLAEYEAFGSISNANSNESSKQAQYAYYSAGNTKGKYRHSATSSLSGWWLRSPDKSTNDSFSRVAANANPTSAASSSANYSYGFAPGFCV